MAMKKQCETILQWQEDVQRVHDSHKAKFEETKHYIENVSENCMRVCVSFLLNIAICTWQLQLENLKLKEDLQKSQEREKMLEEQKRKSSLVDKSSLENVREFELKAAQKRIVDLELALKEKSEEVIKNNNFW